jgi:hypothetical protein
LLATAPEDDSRDDDNVTGCGPPDLTHLASPCEPVRRNTSTPRRYRCQRRRQRDGMPKNAVDRQLRARQLLRFVSTNHAHATSVTRQDRDYALSLVGDSYPSHRRRRRPMAAGLADQPPVVQRLPQLVEVPATSPTAISTFHAGTRAGPVRSVGWLAVGTRPVRHIFHHIIRHTRTHTPNHSSSQFSRASVNRKHTTNTSSGTPSSSPRSQHGRRPP